MLPLQVSAPSARLAAPGTSVQKELAVWQVNEAPTNSVETSHACRPVSSNNKPRVVIEGAPVIGQSVSIQIHKQALFDAQQRARRPPLEVVRARTSLSLLQPGPCTCLKMKSNEAQFNTRSTSNAQLAWLKTHKGNNK